MCAFATPAGRKKDDVKLLADLWRDHGWGERGYFSVGFDCRGAGCVGVFGGQLASPHQWAAAALAAAPYRDWRYRSLSLGELRGVLNP